MKAWDARQQMMLNGSFGRPIVLLDGPNGRRTILDPSRHFGPVISVEGESVTIPPTLLSCPRRQPAPSLSTSPSPQLVEPELQLPADAPWSILHHQWHGNGLPLGMGTNGLLVADPETYPHQLIVGTSGSSKTRFGLRPLITSALASGWQVAIYDRSGLNFFPFQQHPNAHTVFLEDLARAIVCLALLCEVIRERFITLRQAGVSAWGRLPSADTSAPLPAPRVLAVIGEFANRSADAHGEAWPMLCPRMIAVSYGVAPA